MANEFKPTIGSPVAKSEAEKWIKKYDDERRKDKWKDTKSVFYGKDILQKIIDTPGASGMSVFLCLKHSDHAKKEVESFVLVPTSEDGTLIWGEAEGKDVSRPGYDDGLQCPPNCPN